MYELKATNVNQSNRSDVVDIETKIFLGIHLTVG